MKKLLAVGVAGMALATSGAVVVPAQADTRGCVTKAEFRRVKLTHKMAFIHNVFDTRGRQTYIYSSDGYSFQSRDYRACRHPKYSYLNVGYEYTNGAWRLTSKTSYWG